MKYDGTIIHSQRDEYGLIEVVENPITRKLYFDSPIEQSCIYLNAPMTLNFEYQEKIIERVLEFADSLSKQKTLRVLMLGMGGGSMAHHLFHNHPNLQMTVVELRQAVIDCAYRFFQLPDEPEIEVVQEDALEFVAQNQSAYDVIIVDIFDAEGLPSGMSNTEFQQNLWNLSADKSVLIFNLWNQWNQTHKDGKTIPTEEAQRLLDYWQNHTNEKAQSRLNRYNIQSSQNLILEILKSG